MVSGMTRREKLMTVLAGVALTLFVVDAFALTPYREALARRTEESHRLADRRLALRPYADGSVTATLVRQAEALERQAALVAPPPPHEPTDRLIPRLTDSQGSGTLRLVGLSRTDDAVETISLSILADHPGALRLLRRLDQSDVRLTQLSLNRTNGDGAPLAIGLTMERNRR